MRRIISIAAALFLLAGLVNVRSAAASPVEDLRVQKVGAVTYFHARLAEPKGLTVEPGLTPRLVPQDGKVRMVCARDGVEFLGRCDGTGPAKCVLQYAVRGGPRHEWKESELVLDFDRAKPAHVPKEAGERRKRTAKDRGAPHADDLEGLWAAAHAEQFRRARAGVSGFGFLSFAEAALSRKYRIGDGRAAERDERRALTIRPGGEGLPSELYNLTTGSAAIAETLALRRMNGVGPPDRSEKRELPVAKLRGIDVAEHPWKKLIGDKKPAEEPLAAMVPHDNYYVAFKRLDRLAAFAELAAAWGGNLLASYEASSRDERLWRRYEKQLCLNVAELAKDLDAGAVTAVAVTGSDLYLREGSDLAVLFRVADRRSFDAAVWHYLADARKAFGERLSEGKYQYQGVPIDRHVSPLREVSLYRAVIGDVVVHCNSPTALRRLIDAARGKAKRLSDSLDFRYMRTVFRHDDRAEDGFAFLSDAFIRQLVGPASKIKQARRLEALASLHMLTYGAMLTRWEARKLPRSAEDVLTACSLTAAELPSGGKKPLVWDAARGVAISDAFGTLHFSTPLVEQVIDNVTRTEADEYERFRREYLGLWRQYFDPIGMRVGVTDREVKLEAYVLPLVENTAYDWLRRLTGKGSVRITPSAVSPKTLAQVVMHLNDDAEVRKEWGLGELGPLSAVTAAVDPVGRWLMVRMDHSPHYAEAARLVIGGPIDLDRLRSMWSVPVAVGFDVRNKLTLTAALAAARANAMKSLPRGVTWGPLEKEHKGVSIVRVQATARRSVFPGPTPGTALALPRAAGPKDFRPAFYYALIDDAFFITLNEEMMRRVIDDATAKRDKGATVAVNSSLYLSPAEGKPGLITRTLERAVHRQALAALPVWEALYRCGVIAPDDPPEKAAGSAYRLLGFVPVSPDGTAFRFDAKAGEVVNERHGSLRRPTPREELLAGSPVARLLGSVGSLRADLRFREDGIHTTLTLKRPGK